LEYLLLILKVLGLIGAFVGLSGDPPRAGGITRRRIWAFSFLAIAIGAELVDAQLKRRDAKEDAFRFERLAHPLGTIRVTPMFSLSLGGSELSEYQKRLVAAQEVLPPDPKSEPAAAALLTAGADIWIALYRVPPPARIDEQEPDLSFSTDIGQRVPRTDTSAGESAASFMRIADQRNYNYHDGAIHAQLQAMANSPDDRFSNGAIISTVDLQGAELEIRFCPSVLGYSLSEATEAELAGHVQLEMLYVAFPGRQEFAISPDRPGVRTVAPSKKDTCSHLFYTFPSGLEDFKKAQVEG
jgi:hypothetical protein